MEQKRRYPIGIQTFSELVNKQYLYIDKTEYVYRMAHGDSSYLFLNRPRRFGKSLLTSTLHAYFEGRKELFKGLAVEQLETEWTPYPVLHLDMSLGKHMNCDTLNRYLHSILEDNEKRLGITPRETVDANIRLKNLILDVHARTGKQVVILVDEYDAPLLDVVHEEKQNNIQNISMLPEYAAVCGITQEEMETQMDVDIDILASRLNLSREDTLQRLKFNYDGYHFTWPSPDIYNPFSLLGAFGEGRLNSFWFGSGTPTYLIEMLRKYGTLPSEIDCIPALAVEFDAPTERMQNIAPLLYQSGYVTIKGYDEGMELYTLGLPNKEVRVGLMRSLLPSYVMPDTLKTTTMIAYLSRDIIRGEMDAALSRLQEFLGTVPYAENTHYEGHYQQMFYVIFSLLGMYVDIEVRTPRGRVDVVLRTPTTLYVIELKLDRSADVAMNQINLKQYPERFVLCGLPVVKVGINFDTEKRTISDWRIEQ